MNIEQLITILNGMDARDLEIFWENYLPLLAKSIHVKYRNKPKAFASPNNPGWGDSRDGYPWSSRAPKWYSSTTFGYYLPSKFFTGEIAGLDLRKVIPMFPSYVIKALEATVTNNKIEQEEPKMMNNLKTTTDKVLNKNKESARIATKLMAGKTANTFLLSKLLGNFPWYAKLWGKRNKVEENPLAKLIAAETAMTLVTHFAPENDKLNYIAESMVDEALVDITYNSAMLENFILELDKAVKLPAGLFDTKGD